MGAPPPFPFPGDREDAHDWLARSPWITTFDRPLPPPLAPVTWRSARIHILLLLLTMLSIFVTGGLRVVSGPGGAVFGIDWVDGLLMVAGMVSILLAHEMGHWVTARVYGVDATLPFFIPLPLSIAGTLGAFIRIRSPIPHRKALFDIGIAGPLAGFVVCLPVLALGVLEARVEPLQAHAEGFFMGEPLLFQWMASLLVGPIPEGMTMAIGPLGLAAWFGLLVTALNMMPIGQLDGGHVTYALLRRKAWIVSRIAFGACLLLLYLRPTWLLWAVLMWVLRRPHPPTLDDEPPIGRARVVVGILGFVVFAICFTPSPFVVSWSDFVGGFAELFGFTSR